MRVVFCADTHLGFDLPSRPRVAKARRGQDFFDNFQRILDHTQRVRADLLVHGGDVFFRARVAPAIVNMAYEALAKVARSGTAVLLVPGNHDRSRLPGSFWLAGAGVQVFDRPRTFRLARAGATVAVSGFPFVRDDVRGRFAALVEETGWRDVEADVRLLCMHQLVEGATVGPSGFVFRSGSDVVAAAALPPAFRLVLAGHVHRAQVLEPGRGDGTQRVVYAGSIERTSFAERHERKGFFDIEFAPVPAGGWSPVKLQFVPLPSRPMVDLRLDGRKSLQQIGDELRSWAAGLDEGAIVRVGVDAGRQEPHLPALSSSFLRSVLPASVRVQISTAAGERRRRESHARKQGA